MATRPRTSGKPFEVKVGVGFPAFGGMYQLGDPSMCPPNRFRRIINVRLGGKDVVSRPGLTAVWSGATNPVIGMAEIFKKSGGSQIWFGPHTHTPDDFTNGATYAALYTSLLIDAAWPILTPHESGAELKHVVQNIPALAALTAAETFQTETWMRLLSPASYMPWTFAIGPGAPVGRFVQAYGYFFRGGIVNSPAPTAAPGGNSHSHRREQEIALSTVVPARDYVAQFPDEEQWGNCVDPIVIFQGEWIAVGSIISRVHNPGVLAGKAAAAAGTGQQVFKVLFSPLPVAPPAAWAIAPYAPQNDDNFLGGSLLELFRMPGVTHDRISTTASRASGGLDGETIRSMCVRSVRNDNPITAAQATSEKLYVGTHGGYPLAAGAWITPDVEFRPPIHNLADGKVYSWDGQTRKLERSGLGPAVMVITLPDGSVLACGRSAAALLDATDQTWKAVTYSPVASLLPRFITRDLDPPFPPDSWLVEAVADADWLSTGFIWLNRILFKGEAYFIGFDSARMAQKSTGFQLTNGGHGPYVNPPYQYEASRDALGIYRFNRATLTMTRVRSGSDIWMAMQSLLVALEPANILFQRNDPNILVSSGPPGHSGLHYCPLLSCALATDGERLYYTWALQGSLVAEELVDISGSKAVGIGAYDGVTWDDDAVALRGSIPGPGQWELGVLDMLWLQGRGLLMVSLDVATGTRFVPHLWDGATFTLVADALHRYQYGRLFAGPK